MRGNIVEMWWFCGEEVKGKSEKGPALAQSVQPW